MDQVLPDRPRTKKRLDPSQRRNVAMSFTVRESERTEIIQIAYESGYPTLCSYLRAMAMPHKKKQELGAIR